MKTLVLFSFAAIAAFSQTSIIDVSTPPAIRCVATFQPAVVATDVKVDCYIAGNLVRTSTTKIAVLTGVPNGIQESIATGGNTVAIIMQRPTATAQINISATVNAGTPTVTNVTVP